MYKLIKLTKEEFNTLIANTAGKTKLNYAIVEKDLWVCITLDYLFNHSKWKNQIAFKGGTCLSKAYHLIERFSEDIDLILDWRILGYSVNEPWESRSNTKQQAFTDESKERLFTFLREIFLPEFRKGLSQMLDINCDIRIDENDPGTVVFAYPHSYSDGSILNTIRLEIGVLSSWTPLNEAEVKPFIAEQYPNVFSHSTTKLLATTPERTFWEKITILHQEAHRPDGSLVPERYSRHYYDVYCMCQKGIKDKAIKNPDLLEDVAFFKSKFYPRKWARYDLARFGTIKLMPAHHNVERLKNDYEIMKKMIYGVYPSFDDILKVLDELEKEINKIELELSR